MSAVRRSRSSATAVAALYDAARDAELALLDDLVERAGLGWKCAQKADGRPCAYMNVGRRRCGGCGVPRRRGKEE